MFKYIWILLILSLSGCYVVPAGNSGYGHYNERPMIDGHNISCYWNSGYQDYVWSFQAWVNHPAGRGQVSDVAVDVFHNGFMIDSFYLFYEQDGYWSIHLQERRTNLWCGDWYEIDITAYDWDGDYDSITVRMTY